jgi:hypothetical protein
MKFDFYTAEIDEAYDPEALLDGFETTDAAIRARRDLVNALKSFGSKGEEAARAIRECGIRPCASAACPICLRRFRRWWTSQIAGYMASDTEGRYTVTAVPAEYTFPIGELDRFRWDLAKDRLRKSIERSRLKSKIIIGGFDYALQQFDDGRSAKWRPHIYFLVQAGGVGVIESALKHLYPKDMDTSKPLMIQKQKQTKRDLISTASYAYKSSFYERQPTRDKKGHADTDASPLGPSHQAELAVLLHKQGFLGRMIRYGKDKSLPLLGTR